MNCKQLFICKKNRFELSVQLWQLCCRRNKSESCQTMHRALSSAQTLAYYQHKPLAYYQTK